MNLKTAFAVLAAAFAVATVDAKGQYDIRPGESSSEALTAVEWQSTNAAALAAATTPAALAAHVRHDVAHRQAAIAQETHPAHLAGEIVRMHREAAERRALGVGLADLVVHENWDRHGAIIEAQCPPNVRW